MREPQNFTPRTRALPHQREAIDYLVKHPVAALFDEQGLGKTKIVIDAFSQLMATGEIDAALVVSPMTLLFNWELEVAKHSSLVPVVLRGSRRERKYRFLTGANFYIVNYEALLGHIDVFAKLCKSRRFAIALDESTRIKDPRTATAQAVYVLGRLVSRRVIMTGTPIANRPQDLWGQYYFLDEGELLGTSHDAFVARFAENTPAFADELQALSELVNSRCIRRLKDDVLQLPDKVYTSQSVELRGQQLAAYRRCAREMVVELRALDEDSYVRDVDNVLEQLLRLVQLASNPGLLDASYSGPNAKLEALDSLVPDLLSSNDKIILWSSFVENVNTLASRFAEHGALRIHGGVDMADRARYVGLFQDDDVHRVLVANPAAAREGLTLTRASAMVYMDRSFSLTDYLQSQDRIHRIGQDRTCHIHKLVGRGTMDEYVDLVIDLKQTVAQYVYAPGDAGRARLNELLQDKERLLRFLEEGPG